MRRKLRAKRRDVILGRQRFCLYKKFYRSNLSLKKGESSLGVCVSLKDKEFERGLKRAVK